MTKEKRTVDTHIRWKPSEMKMVDEKMEKANDADLTRSKFIRDIVKDACTPVANRIKRWWNEPG